MPVTKTGAHEAGRTKQDFPSLAPNILDDMYRGALKSDIPATPKNKIEFREYVSILKSLKWLRRYHAGCARQIQVHFL